MHQLLNSQKHINTYLINLDRAVDRLADMHTRLLELKLPYERVPAVDGSKKVPTSKEFSRLSYMILHGRRPIPAEIGCYLSHVRCAQLFLESSADFALILEDDIKFESDFLSAIDAAASFSNDWDILRLTSVNRGKKFRIRDLAKRYKLGVALTREKGAGAYLINRRAAKWMVNDLLPMRLSYDIAFDLEFLAGLKAAFVDPLPANQLTGYETQIQKNIRSFKLPRYRYITVLPYRAYLEIMRILFRGSYLVKNLMQR